MNVTEKTLEVFLPPIEIQSQALVVAVPNYYEKTVSSHSSISDLLQNKTLFAAVENSLHVSGIFLNDD